MACVCSAMLGVALGPVRVEAAEGGLQACLFFCFFLSSNVATQRLHSGEGKTSARAGGEGGKRRALRRGEGSREAAERQKLQA